MRRGKLVWMRPLSAASEEESSTILLKTGDAVGNLFSAHPVRLKIGADVYRPFTTTESTMARTASSLARIVAPSPPCAGML